MAYASYPTAFAETLTPLDAKLLDDAGQKALTSLGRLGLGVYVGFRREDVSEVGRIAQEEGVVEFCPRDGNPDDPKARFPDEERAEAWQQRGPGMFQLRSLADFTLGAYSWTRPETCSFIPGQETTSAFRVSKKLAGKGIGTLLAAVTVSGAAGLYGAKNIGLETWASNTGAVRAYLKSGATLVTTKDDYRPTLRPDERETNGIRRDVRLFMRFPWTFAKK